MMVSSPMIQLALASSTIPMRSLDVRNPLENVPSEAGIADVPTENSEETLSLYYAKYCWDEFFRIFIYMHIVQCISI
jgi:hypothetical protein